MTDLTYLQKSDKELDSLRWQANKAGAQARKEIQRRKAIGYCDGTAIQTVDAKEPMEVESTLGTSPERVYAAGVRRNR